MKKKRFQVIADKIRDQMAADSSYAPSSVSEIMDTYGANSHTACMAVAVLVKEGLLVSKRGKGIQRAGVAEDPSDRVYRRIIEAISNGAWSAGERLPKCDYLVSEYGVSRTTVSMAVHRLARDILVHKKGKSWIIGPPPAHRTGEKLPPDLGAVALILSSDVSARPEASSFLRPFLQALAAELRLGDIDMLYVYRNRVASDLAFIPNQDIDDVRRSVLEWGDRYRGTVVLDRWIDAEGLREWAPVLSGTGRRPIVLFDSAADRLSLNREELSVGDSFHNLHLDEHGAVELAVRRLADAGHRSVGVPVFASERGGWVEQRAAAIDKYAHRYGIRLLQVTVDEPLFDVDLDSPESWQSPWGFQHRLSAWMEQWEPLKGGGSGTARRGPGELLRQTRSLGNAVANGATALLCLNDTSASQCYLWCWSVGLKVPQDLTVVSFDNSSEFQLLPLATVDFGFARLGYLAGRIIRGAAPAEAGRTGTIPGICSLVNRGSLGPPNQRTAGWVRAIAA